MPIYGRSHETYSDGLHRLSEVTLELPMAEMRRIAEFLLSYADAVEAGKIRTGHTHMNPHKSEWDVIACHPSPEPPRRVT
jgi:hypothetical protein